MLSFSECKKFAKYVLPYHKGNPDFLRSPCAIQFFKKSSACPIHRLKTYLRLRDRLHFSESALFIRENGTLPSGSWFLRTFHRLFPRDFSGHSLRLGGATALAQNGASMDFIQSAGRWSSDAFCSYVRGHVVLSLPERLNHPIGSDHHIGAHVFFSRKLPRTSQWALFSNFLKAYDCHASFCSQKLTMSQQLILFFLCFYPWSLLITTLDSRSY